VADEATTHPFVARSFATGLLVSLAKRRFAALTVHLRYREFGESLVKKTIRMQTVRGQGERLGL